MAEYVKKRDRRITEYLAKQQKEREETERINEEKKKKENEEKAQRLQRLKEEREREWAQQMAEMEDGSDEAMLFQEEDEDGGKKSSEIYCAPCKKLFKSEKQYVVLISPPLNSLPSYQTLFFSAGGILMKDRKNINKILRPLQMNFWSMT